MMSQSNLRLRCWIGALLAAAALAGCAKEPAEKEDEKKSKCRNLR